MAEVRLTFKGESRAATDAARDVDQALDDLAQQAAATRAALSAALAGIESNDAVREFQAVENQLEALSRQAVATRAALQTATDVDEADVDRNNRVLAALVAGLGGAVASAGLLKSALGDFKQPALYAGFGIGAQAVGALGAAAVALLSALAPLSGALVAYPAILGAFVQGMVAGKIALGGIGDAFKTAALPEEEFRKKLADLSPEMQRFAIMLRSDVIPQTQAFRDEMQKPVLAAISTEIQRAFGPSGIFAVFRTGMLGTADVLARLIQRAGDLAASPAFQERFAAIMGQNNVTLERMGTALLSIVDAMTHVLVAAGPLIDWITRGIVAFGEWARNAAQAGEESGRLAAFFDRTRETITLLWNVLRPLGQTFLEIGKAAAPLGREILRDLAIQAERLAAWAQSEGGRETLRRYFENAKPIVYEMARLVRDVTGAVLELSAIDGERSGLLTFMRRIRTEVLPLFAEAAKGATTAFGPALADAIIEILRLFGLLAGENGPLVALVRTIGSIAKAFSDLLENNPLLRDFVFTLTGILTWAKLISAIGIVGLVVRFGAALLGLGTAAGTSAVGFSALSAAMRANPIGAVITALQILIAAVIVAYQRSETFRNVVHGLFDVLRTVGSVVGTVISAFTDIGRTVQTLLGAFSSVIDFLRNNWRIVATLIAGPFAPIVALATDAFGIRSRLVGAFNAILDFLRSNWRTIATVISGPFAPLVALATDAFGVRSALTRALTGIAATARSIGTAIQNGIRAGITGIGTFVSSTLSGLGRLLSNAVSGLGNAGTRAGTAIRTGISRGVTGVGSFVASALSGLGRLLSSTASRLGSAAFSMGRSIVNGVGRGLSGIGTVAWGIIKSVPNALFRAINAIRIPSVSITIPVPFAPDISFRIPPIDPIPNIPYLARGGIVTAPTLAMIGERGREAVVPLPDRADLLGSQITVPVHVEGSVIRENDLVRSITDGIVRSLRSNPGVLSPSSSIPR